MTPIRAGIIVRRALAANGPLTRTGVAAAAGIDIDDATAGLLRLSAVGHVVFGDYRTWHLVGDGLRVNTYPQSPGE